MAKLSTHVLDTLHGRPAAGVRVELHRIEGREARLIVETRTNADGRTDRPLLEGVAVTRGRYRLTFHIGDYFRATGVALPDPPFVDRAVIQFGITDAAAHYHVPLLASPWSYTTYRGS